MLNKIDIVINCTSLGFDNNIEKTPTCTPGFATARFEHRRTEAKKAKASGGDSAFAAGDAVEALYDEENKNYPAIVQRDYGDGTYMLGWRAEASGVYAMHVTIDGLHVIGSPAQLLMSTDGGVPTIFSTWWRAGGEVVPRKFSTSRVKE